MARHGAADRLWCGAYVGKGSRSITPVRCWCATDRGSADAGVVAQRDRRPGAVDDGDGRRGSRAHKAADGRFEDVPPAGSSTNAVPLASSVTVPSVAPDSVLDHDDGTRNGLRGSGIGGQAPGTRTRRGADHQASARPRPVTATPRGGPLPDSAGRRPIHRAGPRRSSGDRRCSRPGSRPSRPYVDQERADSRTPA